MSIGKEYSIFEKCKINPQKWGFIIEVFSLKD